MTCCMLWAVLPSPPAPTPTRTAHVTPRHCALYVLPQVSSARSLALPSMSPLRGVSWSISASAKGSPWAPGDPELQSSESSDGWPSAAVAGPLGLLPAGAAVPAVTMLLTGSEGKDLGTKGASWAAVMGDTDTKKKVGLAAEGAACGRGFVGSRTWGNVPVSVLGARVLQRRGGGSAQLLLHQS